MPIDYNNFLTSLLNYNKIKLVKEERAGWLKRESSKRFEIPYKNLEKYKASFIDFSGDKVVIGKNEELTNKQLIDVETNLRKFMPWRKGPFNIFGIDIDAEWQSNRKWNRLKNYLPDLKGKVVADIGSNNGYYMFKMAELKPELVIGFDPTIQYYYTFKSLNAMAGCENLQFELLGVEHIHFFEDTFDVIFLMGILYHHPSPIDLLKNVKKALKKDGVLILETQGIPGEGAYALFPEKRYAKVPGTYFVPTVECLQNFMKRSGFRDFEIFCSHDMNSIEQRKTDWMVYESYEDFLDPLDSTKTIEGYLAPIRIYLKANN